MKQRLGWTLALCGAATAAAGELSWVKSYDEAVTRAAASGRLVMVDFWADG